MSRKICSRFGIVAGASTGLVMNMIGSLTCCGPLSIPVWHQILYGVGVAVIVAIPAIAFASLVSRRPTSTFLIIGLIIAIIIGLLLGPVAYALPHPSVAMVACAVLGAVLAVLICWLLCFRRDWRPVAGLR